MTQGAPELTTTLEDSAQEPESEQEGLTCSGKLESFDLEKEAKRLKEYEERVRVVAENIQLSIVAQASVLRHEGPFEAGMY